jgi:mevalonate kinase
LPTAHAKLILLGEHFVLYGQSALVCGLPLALSLTLTPDTAQSWHSKQLLSDQDKARAEEVLWVVMQALKVPPQPFRIDISSSIPSQSHLGSSAAFCVTLTQALDQQFNLRLTADRIIETATLGENVLHGKSSGLDPLIAFFGGIQLVTPGTNGKLDHQSLASAVPLPLVIARTPSVTSTKLMVAGVKFLFDQDPDLKQEVLNNYQLTLLEAAKSLLATDLVGFGKALNDNHALLQKINVSAPPLDHLCQTALQSGALGAKLTGGGGGGSMFALCADSASQDKVAQALTPLSQEVMQVTI